MIWLLSLINDEAFEYLKAYFDDESTNASANKSLVSDGCSVNWGNTNSAQTNLERFFKMNGFSNSMCLS